MSEKEFSSRSDVPEKSLVRGEQVRLLYDALPLAAVVALINAVILVYVQWDVVARKAIYIWFGMILIVTLSRLALVIVYMVLASQFESLVHPLTVMLAVPLAAVGGLVGCPLGGVISDCSAEAQVSGEYAVGGLLGMTRRSLG